jgi:hypothetical protein
MDDNLASKFESITRTILSNQTEALTNLTSKATQIFNNKQRTLKIIKKYSVFKKVKIKFLQYFIGNTLAAFYCISQERKFKNKTNTLVFTLVWIFLLHLIKVNSAGGEGDRAGVATDGYHVQPALQLH